MATLVESLDAGINAATDPAYLSEGQMVAAVNAVYPPDSDELLRMPGRQEHQLLDAAATVCGLATCRFDNGEHYLLAQTALDKVFVVKVESSAVATANNWDSTGEGSLVAAQYSNRYFIYNGADQPKVLLQDGTTRQMGLSPVTAQLGGLATAAGTWMGIATGYFDYWITEVYRSTASAENANEAGPFELESAYTVDPQTIKVTDAATQRVKITLPGERINAIATHWRIYRAGPKATVDSKEFPIGEQVIKDIPITNNFGAEVYDGSTISYAWSPSANATGNQWTNSSATASQWTDPANIYGVGVATQPMSAGLPAECSNVFTGGSMPTTVKDPIVGIRVDVVYAMITGAGTDISRIGGLGVKIKWGTDTTWRNGGLHRPDRFTTVTGTNYTAVYGGEASLWGATQGGVSVADLATNNLRISLHATAGNASAPKYTVDSVVVTVFHNGAGITTYKQYNAIVIDTGLDATSAISAAGLAPIGSTATVFEGALVSNDIAHPSHVRYSQAGYPEYWPSLYFIDLETTDNDQVTCVATVNNKLVVGQRGAIFRVNYLPTEQDAGGQRGLAMECISEAHGILNPKCATTFTGPDGRQLLAFVSHNGVFATDGYTITKLSKNLSWKQLSDPTDDTYQLVIALTNDADAGQLWLYTNTVAYTLHYQGGRLRWTGPQYMNNVVGADDALLTAACAARLSTGNYLQFLGYTGDNGAGGGRIYATDQPWIVGSSWAYLLNLDIPNDDHPGMSITTRDIYPGGRGAEARLNYLNVYGETGDTVTPIVTCRLTNAADLSPITLSWPEAGNKLRRIQANGLNADAYSITLDFDGGVRTIQEIALVCAPAEEASIA